MQLPNYPITQLPNYPITQLPNYPILPIPLPIPPPYPHSLSPLPIPIPTPHSPIHNLQPDMIARLYAKETKETLWSLATKGLAAVLFVALNAYLARALGVELFGVWSFLLSNLTIVFLLSYLGLNNATRAFVARYNGSRQLSAVLRASLSLRLAISAGFTTAFILWHRPLAALIGRPELSALFLFAAPLVFLMGMVEYLKQVFTGLHRLKYHFIVNLFEFGLKIGLSVLFLELALGLRGVVLAYWLAVLIACGVGFVFWARFYRLGGGAQANPDGSSLEVAGNTTAPLRSDTRPRQAEPNFMARIFRYSLPLFLISIGFLILTEVDTLMLGLLSTDYQVGLFAAGKQLANKLPQLALALSMGTMPVFARMNAENREEMRRKFVRILRLNALVFLPLGGVLIMLSPVFMPLLFGQDYRAAALPLQILTVWIVLTTFNMFFNALLDYQGRATRRAVNFLFTMIATVGLNLVLIPRWGAVGAAVSTSAAYAPYVILNGMEVRRLFRER